MPNLAIRIGGEFNQDKVCHISVSFRLEPVSGTISLFPEVHVDLASLIQESDRVNNTGLGLLMSKLDEMEWKLDLKTTAKKRWTIVFPRIS